MNRQFSYLKRPLLNTARDISLIGLIFLACFDIVNLWASETGSDSLPYVQVAKRLEHILKTENLQSSDVGILVRSLPRNEMVFAQNEKIALNPASNMKIVSTVVALKELGVNYQFETKFFTDRKLSDSRIHHLYVQGGGDPYLVIERLWRVAGDLRNLGIEEIQGDLILDQAFFDREIYAPGWDGKRGNQAYFAQTAALSVNFNAVAVHVAPESKVGLPPRIFIDPPVDHFQVQNDAKTIGAWGKKSIIIDRQMERHIERQMEGQTEHQAPGQSREIIRVQGNIPLGSAPVMRYRNVSDPVEFSGQVLKHVLTNRGISFQGRIRSGALAKGSTLLFVEKSPPLAEIIRQVNKRSNNFMTEQIIKTLAAEKDQLPGSTRKGMAYLEKYLHSLGIEDKEFHLLNASGLSRENRISANALVQVLENAWSNPSIQPEFFSSLALGGMDGTLEDREITWNKTASFVRAKTGSVKKVSCISGYINRTNGDILAFSFLMNNLKKDHNSIHRIQDEMIQELMEFKG